MKKTLFGLMVVGVAAMVMGRNQQDDLDPLKVAGDSHKLAMENKFVRVLDVHLTPGKVEPLHRHPHGLSVYFQDWDAEVTVQGKPMEKHHRKAGSFAWSEATVHEVRNASPHEAHILRIELKF